MVDNLLNAVFCGGTATNDLNSPIEDHLLKFIKIRLRLKCVHSSISTLDKERFSVCSSTIVSLRLNSFRSQL